MEITLSLSAIAAVLSLVALGLLIAVLIRCLILLSTLKKIAARLDALTDVSGWLGFFKRFRK